MKRVSGQVLAWKNLHPFAVACFLRSIGFPRIYEKTDKYSVDKVMLNYSIGKLKSK